nr:condensation domain-containing protein [Pseudomonadota bacterium]
AHYDASPGDWYDEITLAPDADLAAALTPYAAGLDLSRGPLFRAVLVELAAGGQRLYLAAHHLAIDTVSWHILLDGFCALYPQIAAGAPPSLPPKTSACRQWAQRLRRYADSMTLARQRDYWRAQETPLPLPVEQPQGGNTYGDEICLIGRLSAGETRQLLQEANSAYRTKVPELLLAALTLTLSEWSGQDGLALEMESHGREALFPELDLSRTVGWFTTLTPVRLTLPQGRDPAGCIKAVKEQLRALPEHGLGYGVLRYLAAPALDPTARAGVLFNYLGRLDGPQERGLLAISPEPWPADKAPANARSHELEIVPGVLDGRLQVEWRFSAARCARTTQQRLLDDFLARLRALIRHCLTPAAGGFTPTDFPLAKGLDQQTLDKVLNKLNPKPVAAE